jgi:hypothetical protein
MSNNEFIQTIGLRVEAIYRRVIYNTVFLTYHGILTLNCLIMNLYEQ